MPFEYVDLQSPNVSFQEVLRRTVENLRSGKTVVLPTETVYGLAVRAADADAVMRLIRIKGRAPEHPFALAFPNLVAISDYAVEMSALAQRLARRCLPGPVSLVLDVSPRESAFHLLPQFVRRATSRNLTVSFRVPDHPFIQSVLTELEEPVVLTSANKTGHGNLFQPEEIIADLGTHIDMFVADGALSSARSSTVVSVNEEQFSIVREGAVKKETLERLAARMFLFVCTGNTCRSPMAERICEYLLAERLGCSPVTLEEKGFVVLSAGLSAAYDAPASSQAVEVMKQRGIDLTNHRSQSLKEPHIRFADHIFTMTRAHREAILSLCPNADTRLNVLRVDGGDISDPYGGSESVYFDCARQMEAEIRKRLDQIL